MFGNCNNFIEFRSRRDDRRSDDMSRFVCFFQLYVFSRDDRHFSRRRSRSPSYRNDISSDRQSNRAESRFVIVLYQVDFSDASITLQVRKYTIVMINMVGLIVITMIIDMTIVIKAIITMTMTTIIAKTKRTKIDQDNFLTPESVHVIDLKHLDSLRRLDLETTVQVKAFISIPSSLPFKILSKIRVS